ncbi:MAG: HipA domain-containing protein [Acetatifactor sp.]|nr:HipA domain-containing protein [Acetatifactor sp.]
MRCLCCNKEMTNPSEYERNVSWHVKCIKKFFGTGKLPEIDMSEKALERLANQTVNKGLTIPGVQKKMSLHLETVDKVARLTIVNHPTGYILKPQSEEYPELPEAEFLSMKMAEIAGIKTVPNALLRFQGTYAYVTKRIDRDGEKTYAMEDFCQLSGRVTADKYRSSYETCGKVIKKYSHNVGLDVTEFYYRLLFCFCTCNSDMHLKNFSLIEDRPGSRKFSLSAAYDMLPVNVIMPADKEQMALTMNGKKRNLKLKDFLILAESLGIQQKVATDLIKQILRYKEAFLKEIAVSYVSEEMKEKLGSMIQKRMEIF